MRKASATSTIALQPVVLAVSATSQGTVAAKSVLLTTKVAITNNTSSTISIIGEGCDFRGAPIYLQLHYPDDQSSTSAWNNLEPTNSCPGPGEFDVQSISSGSTYVWSEEDHLFYKLDLNLHAGVNYTMSAILWLWHQGDLSQIGTPTLPQGTDVIAQTTVTFA